VLFKNCEKYITIIQLVNVIFRRSRYCIKSVTVNYDTLLTNSGLRVGFLSTFIVYIFCVIHYIHLFYLIHSFTYTHSFLKRELSHIINFSFITSSNHKYNGTFTRNKPPLISILKIYVLTFTPTCRLYNVNRFNRLLLSFGAVLTESGAVLDWQYEHRDKSCYCKIFK